jgi:hypothetical protein
MSHFLVFQLGSRWHLQLTAILRYHICQSMIRSSNKYIWKIGTPLVLIDHNIERKSTYSSNTKHNTYQVQPRLRLCLEESPGVPPMLPGVDAPV